MPSSRAVTRRGVRALARHGGRALSRYSPYIGAAAFAYENRNAIGSAARGIYRGVKRAGSYLSGRGKKTKGNVMQAPNANGYHGGKTTRAKMVFKGARKNKYLKKAFKYITAPLVWKDDRTKNMPTLQNIAGYHQITHLTTDDMKKMAEITHRQRAAQSGGTLPGGGSTDFDYRDTWIYVQNCKVHYKFTNNSAYPCQLELYQVKYRRDGNSLVADMMVAGTADINGNKIAAGPSLEVTSLSMYPKDYPEVRNKVSMWGKRTQLLAPGEIYEHKQTFEVERLVPSAVVFPNTSSSTNTLYLAGYSVGLLARITGFPNHSKADGNDIGTMKADIDCVYTREMNFRPMSYYGKHIEYTNGLAEFNDPEFYNNDKGTMQYIDSITNLLVDSAADV